VALEREMDRPNSLGAALTALGYCRLELSQTSEARQAFAEAVSITEKLRTQAGGGVEESQRFLEGKLRAYHGILSFLQGEPVGRSARHRGVDERARAAACSRMAG
jgi:hypothetical protein